MRSSAIILALTLLVAGIAPDTADAQLGSLKKKIKEKAAEKAIDCAIDKFAQTETCLKKKKEEEAKKAAAAPASAAKASDAKPDALKPGQGAWANFDFVPGDKILFAEDFTVDRVGNFPKRLQLANGTLEVVEWPEGSGKRWLRSMSESEFSVTLPQALPELWTMEFEITIPWTGMWVYADATGGKHFDRVPSIFLSGNTLRVGTPTNEAEVNPQALFGDGTFRVNGEMNYASRPFKIRVQADGDYMKVYADEQRIGNMPNMGRWQGNKLFFRFRNNVVNGIPFPPLFTGLSINAGGKELYDKLMANGRLAVQGIYFDVGSDRIRPESSGTLTEIVEMMKEHADLRLTVEGHTDNTGVAAANKTLSEQRAAAVVKYLTEKGIDAGRLGSAGFGDSKPAAPNDSPENRQRNRRVELVKM